MIRPEAGGDVAGGEVAICLLRLSKRPLARNRYDSTESGAESLQAIEIELRELNRGDLFLAQERSELLDVRVGIVAAGDDRFVRPVRVLWLPAKFRSESGFPTED